MGTPERIASNTYYYGSALKQPALRRRDNNTRVTGGAENRTTVVEIEQKRTESRNNVSIGIETGNFKRLKVEFSGNPEAIEAINYLEQNWKNLSPEDRQNILQYITSGGRTALRDSIRNSIYGQNLFKTLSFIDRRFINSVENAYREGKISAEDARRLLATVRNEATRMGYFNLIATRFNELPAQISLSNNSIPTGITKNDPQDATFFERLAKWAMNNMGSAGSVLAKAASASSYETVNTVLQNVQRETDQMMSKIEKAQQEKQTEAAKQEFNQAISRTVRNIRASLEQLEQMAENAKTENSALYTAITDRLAALKQQLSQLESAAANGRLTAENARTRTAAIQRELNEITAAHTSGRIESQENVFDKTLNKLVAEYRQTSTTQARRNQLARDMQSVLRAKEAVSRFEAMAENNFSQIKNLPAFTAMRELIGMERDLTIAANIRSDFITAKQNASLLPTFSAKTKS